ncbi:MAG: SPOR domain-containing protein [Alkalispirochaetaceae bacterium]
MEQQKVLIIIISAALFIAAVLGVGLALFYPDAGGSAAPSAREFDPIEYARPESEPESESEPRDEERVVVFGETEEERDDDRSEERVILLTEDPPREEEESGEEETITSRPATAQRSAERGEADGETTPAPQTAPSREPDAAQREQTASYQRAPEPAPRRMRVTEHWIQLISSPNRDRVDQVREQLRERYSLGGRVTSREVGDTTYYRLRLGPYDDREEAEKFLAWIRDIDGFSAAYISEEYPLRTVR